MSLRTGILVQIRMGSSRLPGKALLPLAGLPIAAHVMRALALVPAEVRALITDEASAAALKAPARAGGFELFVGPGEDVLARYAQAARHFAVERVVRATGDNPLVSPLLARRIVELHQAADADLSHFLGCPLGTGVEVIEGRALAEADAAASESYEREHVTAYLYRHRERFAVIEPPCPPDCLAPDSHVTVDTPGDYERMAAIFAALYEGGPIEADRLVVWLRSAAA